MTAKLLMVLSASIIFTLGVTHLVYTFWGTGLTPRRPALRLSMNGTSPVLTNETTMCDAGLASMPPTAWYSSCLA
jgi:hypothetical protein